MQHNILTADTHNTILAVDRFIKVKYYKEGYYDKESIYRNEISKFLYSKHTNVYYVTLHESIIGTISLILDSNIGLPMEKIFNAQINALRKKNARLAEVSQFVTTSSSLQLPLDLMRQIFLKAQSLDIDFLCIAVNPKHETVYRSFHFDRIGDCVNYNSANHAPAVAMFLNIKKVSHKIASGKIKGIFATHIAKK